MSGTQGSRGASDGDAGSLAGALVGIPSVNPSLAKEGQGEEAIAAQAAEWLVGWGLDTTAVEVAPLV